MERASLQEKLDWHSLMELALPQVSIGCCLIPQMQAAPCRYEISKYCENTSKVYAQVLQNLRVCRA